MQGLGSPGGYQPSPSISPSSFVRAAPPQAERSSKIGMGRTSPSANSGHVSNTGQPVINNSDASKGGSPNATPPLAMHIQSKTPPVSPKVTSRMRSNDNSNVSKKDAFSNISKWQNRAEPKVESFEAKLEHIAAEKQKGPEHLAKAITKAWAEAAGDPEKKKDLFKAIGLEDTFADKLNEFSSKGTMAEQVPVFGELAAMSEGDLVKSTLADLVTGHDPTQNKPMNRRRNIGPPTPPLNLKPSEGAANRRSSQELKRGSREIKRESVEVKRESVEVKRESGEWSSGSIKKDSTANKRGSFELGRASQVLENNNANLAPEIKEDSNAYLKEAFSAKMTEYNALLMENNPANAMKMATVIKDLQSIAGQVGDKDEQASMQADVRFAGIDSNYSTPQEGFKKLGDFRAQMASTTNPERFKRLAQASNGLYKALRKEDAVKGQLTDWLDEPFAASKRGGEIAAGIKNKSWALPPQECRKRKCVQLTPNKYSPREVGQVATNFLILTLITEGLGAKGAELLECDQIAVLSREGSPFKEGMDNNPQFQMLGGVYKEMQLGIADVPTTAKVSAVSESYQEVLEQTTRITNACRDLLANAESGGINLSDSDKAVITNLNETLGAQKEALYAGLGPNAKQSLESYDEETNALIEHCKTAAALQPGNGGILVPTEASQLIQYSQVTGTLQSIPKPSSEEGRRNYEEMLNHPEAHINAARDRRRPPESKPAERQEYDLKTDALIKEAKAAAVQGQVLECDFYGGSLQAIPKPGPEADLGWTNALRAVALNVNGNRKPQRRDLVAQMLQEKDGDRSRLSSSIPSAITPQSIQNIEASVTNFYKAMVPMLKKYPQLNSEIMGVHTQMGATQNAVISLLKNFPEGESKATSMELYNALDRAFKAQ